MKVPVSVSFDLEVYQDLDNLVNSRKEVYKSLSNFVNELTKKELAQIKKPQSPTTKKEKTK